MKRVYIWVHVGSRMRKQHPHTRKGRESSAKTGCEDIQDWAAKAVPKANTDTVIGSDNQDEKIYTVTTFKYVEGGPDREAPEVVWNTSSFI